MSWLNRLKALVAGLSALTFVAIGVASCGQPHLGAESPASCVYVVERPTC